MIDAQMSKSREGKTTMKKILLAVMVFVSLVSMSDTLEQQINDLSKVKITYDVIQKGQQL